VLGRTPHTLRLKEDNVGLRYEITPPDTQDGRDIRTLIERGDIRGSSFSFTVAKDGDTWEETDGVILRTVTRVSTLVDVGPVTFPAYEHAQSVGLRHAGFCQDAVTSFGTWQQVDEEVEQRRRRYKYLDAMID
jgi:hypothetical protein